MSNADSERRIVLVRHGQVAGRYAGLCYGRSDVELSIEGLRQSDELAAQLASSRIDHLFHSGLARTRILADKIAALADVSPIEERALAELDFGDWELRPWEEIHAAEPMALDRMLGEPTTFAPPAGETLAALGERVERWYARLPSTGTTVAIAHGGSIAALVGLLQRAPYATWPTLVPKPATIVELSRPTAGDQKIPN